MNHLSENPIVALVRCRDYDRGRVCEAVEQAISLLPGFAERLRPGAKVLLKPNLLSAHDAPEAAVNTHPEFVRACAKWFLARGCHVFIGDSCGSLAPGSTDDAIRVTGLDKVGNELGVQIMNFDRQPSRMAAVPEHRILESIQIPQLLNDIDLLVTLPKFKTHGLCSLTGAVKNQLGLLPGKRKKEVHLAAPKPDKMAAALVDIHSVVKPGLALMDAIIGMEGNGPAAGKAREVGLVMASEDCVAMDAVMAELMGYRPGEVDTTRMADERGLGVGRLERIVVRGAPLSEARMPDFRKPPRKVRSAVFGIMPKSLVRSLFSICGVNCARVIDERCIACGECIANCPAHAIRRRDGKVVIDPKACIGCYCCSEVCERRAIAIQSHFIGRLLRSVFSPAREKQRPG